jgi:hypothetical protein
VCTGLQVQFCTAFRYRSVPLADTVPLRERRSLVPVLPDQEIRKTSKHLIP